MITELTNYISKISSQFPLEDFVKPTEGLHIMLEVQDGQVKLYKSELYQPKKGEEDSYSDFIWNECLPRELHLHYINSNKSISDKKIHSASPYGLLIKQQSIEDTKWVKDWETTIDKYFIESIRKTKINHTEEEQQIVDIFRAFCTKQLPTLLKELNSYESLKSGNYIVVYLKNFSQEQFEVANQNYMKDNLFNKNDYTVPFENEKFGLSDYLNGDNVKKPYLQHKTAPFKINNRIPQSQAVFLNTFDKYRREGAFITRPLPIFINHEELNSVLVDVIKREGNKISFHHIIKTIIENKNEDIGNYYLLYFLGSDVKDIDFVSSFRYNMDVNLQQIVQEKNQEKDIKIKNIFHFEFEVLQPIFNNQLIQKRKDESIAFRYFDDIENNPKYITSINWQLVNDYRKAFYDYIYKSRRQSVTTSMFHDIMKRGILDDLRHDEIQNEKHTKNSDIRKKLNIWFSLWNFFGKENNTNDLTMANKILQHQERMRSIREPKTDEHIQTDDEFAYAAGQIIYYLLTKSKSGNLTHAALEPFLQKTDMGELKKAIANTFNAYKHEIDFGKGRFEKLCSEVMSYELDGKLKDLMPYILAGYFAISVILEKSTTNKTNDNE